jgi:hypothetical protein
MAVAKVFCPWIFAFFALDDLPRIYENSNKDAVASALVRLLCGGQ